jgi:hypothetical protein
MQADTPIADDADDLDERRRPAWADTPDETEADLAPHRRPPSAPADRAGLAAADLPVLLATLADAADALARLDARTAAADDAVRAGLLARLALTEAAGWLARSGPCSACHRRIRRSSVRRRLSGKSACRRCISSSTVIGRNSGDARSIGTISMSQYTANGSGRRRPRGARFCDGNRGSASSRAPVLVLKPALAAAFSRVWVLRRFMYNLAC